MHQGGFSLRKYKMALKFKNRRSAKKSQRKTKSKKNKTQKAGGVRAGSRLLKEYVGGKRHKKSKSKSKSKVRPKSNKNKKQKKSQSKKH